MVVVVVVVLVVAEGAGRVEEPAGLGRTVVLLGTLTGLGGRLVVLVGLSSSTSWPGSVVELALGGVVGGRIVEGRGGRGGVEPPEPAPEPEGSGLTGGGCWAPSRTRLMVFSSGYFSLWQTPWKSSVSMLHIIIPPKPMDLAYCVLSAKLCMSS